jgi:hypothetical protein
VPSGNWVSCRGLEAADGRPYRAPELLFGPAAYDAPALDLWAAGATLAECYRQPAGLQQAFPGPSGRGGRPSRDSNEWRSDGGSSGSAGVPSPPSRSSHGSDSSPFESPPLDGGRPSNATLFDATYGELGLAGSIFSVLGTPTPESWPVSISSTLLS